MALSSPDQQDFGAFAPRGIVRSILARTRQAGDGWLSRRLAFALRRLAIFRLSGDPVDTEALGARMRLFPYRNVCEKRILFTPQFFDPVELDTLRKRLQPGFVFLDIGANIGGYSLFLAAAGGADCRIVAVEPQPDIFRRLVYNLRLNGFSNVKALAYAIADKDGELTLFVDSENKGESSVKIMRGASGAGSITVQSKKLLTLIREEGLQRVDAAKLDTEGAEDIILESFFAEAPQQLWPRLIIMERGNARWHVDLPKLLMFNGYRVIAETRNNVIYER
ncbi:MAG: FkbM family methyltransferase [Beijerinckiaceae bacterium]